MTAAASFALAGTRYPEREERREGKLDRVVAGVRYFTGGIGTRRRQLARIVPATEKAAAGLEALADESLRERAMVLRARLQRSGFGDPGLASAAFALIREAAARSIGNRHSRATL